MPKKTITKQSNLRSGQASTMKIAVFSSYLPPHVGGIDVVAESQAVLLAERQGIEVRSVTSACGGTSGLVRSGNRIVRRIPAWNYLEDSKGAAFPVFAPSIIWHAYTAVRQSDIVHAHDGFYLSSLAAAFWARVLHKPLVLTQHISFIPHPSALLSTAQKIAYATTGQFIFRSSSKIIILNSRVKTFLQAHGMNDKLVYLPNGVDTSEFSPINSEQKAALREKYNLPKHKTLALFVGRYIPRKGFTELSSIKHISGLSVVFVGGPVPDKQTRSDQYFLGSVTHHAMADIYRMCDIFILPSQGEGFPCSVQEAMACGLPIITTDDPAYGVYQLDRSKVSLIQPTKQAMSVALTALVADTRLRLAMSAYSRSYAVTEFSWSTNIEKLLAIYKDCIL
jgi:D-inositol-3-phosphate glycosyltransferase